MFYTVLESTVHKYKNIIEYNVNYFINITFMHLADAFIKSDLQNIQAIHILSVHVFPGNLTTTFALLTQCSTTEPQEHWLSHYTN